MSEPQNPRTPQTPTPGTPEETRPRKRRRHGYRGYPNNSSAGGDIHFGSGFAGVGSAGPTGGSGLLKSGVITERTREDAEDTE
jgi:hypothetical protein